MIVDNALGFFITTALFVFLLAYRGTFKQGYPIFWLCLAGAFLTKGIIGLAIPGIAVFLFVLWQKDFTIIKRAWVIPGIILLAATLGAWGGILYLRGGREFLSTFFWYNNLGRFLNVGIYQGGHVMPFYHYIPVLFSEGMPWSFILIPALVFLKKPDERLRFFYCWFFGGLLLLSLASTKRNIYFFPMYPAMAVIITVWAERAAQEAASQWEKRWLRFIATLVGLAGLGLPIIYMIIGGSLPAAAAICVLSIALQWFLFKTLAFTIPERIICGWAILIIAWSIVLFPQVDTIKSYKGFFSEAGKAVGKADIIGYDLTETALALSSFYGGFPIENVTDRKQFLDLVSTGKTRYVLFLPRKNDIELGHLLESTGHMLLHIDNKMTDAIHIPAWSGLMPKLTDKETMRPTELWLLSKPSPSKGVH